MDGVLGAVSEVSSSLAVTFAVWEQSVGLQSLSWTTTCVLQLTVADVRPGPLTCQGDCTRNIWEQDCEEGQYQYKVDAFVNHVLPRVCQPQLSILFILPGQLSHLSNRHSIVGAGLSISIFYYVSGMAWMCQSVYYNLTTILLQSYYSGRNLMPWNGVRGMYPIALQTPWHPYTQYLYVYKIPCDAHLNQNPKIFILCFLTVPNDNYT